MPIIAEQYDLTPIPATGVIATVQQPGDSPCCDTPPSVPPVLTPQACAGQNIIVATTPTIHGRPILARTKSFSVTAGQTAILEHTMQDQQGNPVALTSCLEGGLLVKFRLLETLSQGGATERVRTFPATVVDASVGLVRVTLPAEAAKTAGVYFGEFAVVEVENDEQRVLFSNTVYVVINRGLWGDLSTPRQGPPTMTEIRLHLRDTSPDESFLLDTVAFSDEELALAIIRPVEYWNETPPPLRRYTTETFPYRYHWLEAICAQLFLMAEERYRRNSLQYAAAGVQVNDYDKEMNYQRAGQMRQQLWMTFVRQEKYRLNMDAGFGELGGFLPSTPY